VNWRPALERILPRRAQVSRAEDAAETERALAEAALVRATIRQWALEQLLYQRQARSRDHQPE
jgi:hypothetical protein